MSFLSRRKAELAEQGVDSSRVPPGQYVTDRFPVLHAGVTPKVQLAKWDFRVEGLAGEPVSWSYQDMLDMPQTEQTFDIHCVTKWSKLDTTWRGVAVTEVMSRLDPLPGSSHVLVLAEQGFTANIPIADFTRPENLFAHTFGGEPLEPDHGWPLRLVVPHLYFWKSVKWVRGLRFLDHDTPGFWERNGYHMYGDPWREQRYWGD
jgi:DMSO/TMAO reductase YedYZ molybdopterin-dependent catalytic subunit